MRKQLIYIGREPVPLEELVKCFKAALDQNLIEFETFQNAQFYSYFQVSENCYLIKDCFNDMRFVTGSSPRSALKNYINMVME